MAVSTFTMQDVVNGVLNQMRFAPGRDVQIHIQSSIVQDASMFYRSMMKKYVWRDWYYITEQTIDAVTGQPTTVNPNLDRFSNLLRVYKDNESNPLTFAPALINPKRYNRSCITPAPTDKVWRVWPAKAMNVIVWSRNFTDADFELDDPVPFYKDLMVIGTALSLVTKAGINMELMGLFKQQLGELIDIYTLDEIKSSYQVNQNQGSIPDEWYSYDN